MNYDKIKDTIQSINYTAVTKGDVMGVYEQDPSIKVIDSAIPKGWSDEVRKYLGVRNIGEWAWAYLENGSTLPIPCNERALAYFDHFITKEKFIPISNLMASYSIIYETSDGKRLKTGVQAISEDQAYEKFGAKNLGVVRELTRE